VELLINLLELKRLLHHLRTWEYRASRSARPGQPSRATPTAMPESCCVQRQPRWSQPKLRTLSAWRCQLEAAEAGGGHL